MESANKRGSDWTNTWLLPYIWGWDLNMKISDFRFESFVWLVLFYFFHHHDHWWLSIFHLFYPLSDTLSLLFFCILVFHIRLYYLLQEKELPQMERVHCSWASAAKTRRTDLKYIVTGYRKLCVCVLLVNVELKSRIKANQKKTPINGQLLTFQCHFHHYSNCSKVIISLTTSYPTSPYFATIPNHSYKFSSIEWLFYQIEGCFRHKMQCALLRLLILYTINDIEVWIVWNVKHLQWENGNAK